MYRISVKNLCLLNCDINSRGCMWWANMFLRPFLLAFSFCHPSVCLYEHGVVVFVPLWSGICVSMQRDTS